MKITIVTGVWKRPEVFEMFSKGIENLGVDVRVIVAGSEGDTSRTMVESKGFEYIEVPNRPLSNKMNATTRAAKGSDYVICMGSDDIISPELFQEYLKYMNEDYDFVGLTDFYFYDTESKRAMYWGGYNDKRKGTSIGAGCVISAKLLNNMCHEPWKNGLNKGLDGSMQRRINGKVAKFSLKEKGLFALDIKSSTNITPFELWKNSSYIDAQIIKEQFPYLFE